MKRNIICTIIISIVFALVIYFFPEFRLGIPGSWDLTWVMYVDPKMTELVVVFMLVQMFGSFLIGPSGFETLSAWKQTLLAATPVINSTLLVLFALSVGWSLFSLHENSMVVRLLLIALSTPLALHWRWHMGHKMLKEISSQ